jgi:hypothetical protein
MVGGFVAGTPVRTDNGLIPIEIMQVGDLVLSRCGKDGQQAYKRVTNVLQHEPQVVIEVYVTTEDKPNAARMKLVTTKDHPILVEGENWLKAGRLDNHWQSKQRFMLADGSEGWSRGSTNIYLTEELGVGWRPSHMGDETREGFKWDYPNNKFVADKTLALQALRDWREEHDHPMYQVPEEFLFELPVYNLEVEDFHTYYVGELGVCVHDSRNSITKLSLPPTSEDQQFRIDVSSEGVSVKECFSETPENAAKFAESFVTTAKTLRGDDLDFSPRSISKLESLIDAMRGDGVPTQLLPDTFFAMGCYLGEVFVRNGYGRWVQTSPVPNESIPPYGIVLKLEGTEVCDPVGKVLKRFENGEGDSLMFFYEAMAAKTKAEHSFSSSASRLLPDRIKTRTLDDNTRASDPGGVRLSKRKLGEMHPELVSRIRWMLGIWSKKIKLGVLGREYLLTHVEEHLMQGDSRAALVVSVSPLRVAAYTDELDCVALLAFPDQYVSRYELKVGSRLLTVNTYSYIAQGIARDLEEGESAFHRYGNFEPYIAEFLSDDLDRIGERKLAINQREWQRTNDLAARYIEQYGLIARDGRPLACMFAASIPPPN